MEPAGEEEEEALLSRKIPYKFSIRSFLIENLVAYALTISILYLLKLATFSYFELILVLALTVSVQPWRLSNLIMVCAIGITIGNVFLGASAFIYPGIFICYLAVTAFN